MIFFRFLLFPFAILYDFITRIRNYFFDVGILKSTSFEIPVIAVGNLSVGGTGKTPLSIEIYKELKKRKFKPALIKKFYHDHSDEHEMIKNKNINLILNKSRKKCILEAIDKKLDIAVLDDGFQDLSINKNLNIIDAAVLPSALFSLNIIQFIFFFCDNLNLSENTLISLKDF